MDITRGLRKIMVKKQKKAGLNPCRTRAEKDSVLEAYSQANRAVKRSIKAYKRNFVNQLATEAEKVVQIGNMRSLYNTTKILFEQIPKTERPVKNKRGNTSQEGQKTDGKSTLKNCLPVQLLGTHRPSHQLKEICQKNVEPTKKEIRRPSNSPNQTKQLGQTSYLLRH